jgi:hypothetical protein
MHQPPTQDGCKGLVKHLKEFLPVPQRSGISVKAVLIDGRSHTWRDILGYVQKDRGQGHYILVTKGVSQEELAAGYDSYDVQKHSFDEGRVSINKGNLVKQVWAYYTRFLTPLQVPVDHILEYMLQSGTYIPALVWFVSSSGKGTDYFRLNCFIRLLQRGIQTCTLQEARHIFFEDHSFNSTEAQVSDLEWHQSLEQVLATARQLREQQHQAAQPAHPVQQDPQHFTVDQDLPATEPELPAVPPEAAEAAMATEVKSILDQLA